MSTIPSPRWEEFICVEGDIIRLVSYNILAEVYVTGSQFQSSPAPCLGWEARSQAILSVLMNLGADIICLQGVDEYYSFYKRNMERHGYSSIYVKRTGQKLDGCGIFYKQNRFCAELDLREEIQYNDLGVPNDPSGRLKRDCVGIMAAFKLIDPPHHVVIVANTHLYRDPEWADVKLAQAKYLLSRLAQFKTLVSNRLECTPSVIVAGDFNSTPRDEVYDYLGSSLAQDKPIPLCSAYASMYGEPTFTCHTRDGDFTETLDYIFFSPTDNIRPVSVLELPEPDSPDVVGGLPNSCHPSDHLPIGVGFEITWE